MGSSNSSVVVVGAILHVKPENLQFLREQLQNSLYVDRLIIFKESNNKLWLTERGGQQ